MQKKRKKKIIILCVILLVLAILILWGNTAVEINEYTVESEELPIAFDGFRIAQISDLHNGEFGKNNKKLISILEESSPDIIVITGDVIDCNRTDTEISIDFLKKAVSIAPCYYIRGNHEAWITDETLSKFEKDISDLGVILLRNEGVFLEKDGEKIYLSGINDPDFSWGNNYVSCMSVENIMGLSDYDGFKILLSHRPEYFENYVSAGIDLVFSGHAHGGQFRIPFVGGVYAPNQGFFPEYDSGIYEKDDTKMIVSRGIGNSVFPIRLNNRPEVVIVELKTGGF